MKVKSYLGTVERRSAIAARRLAARGGFTGLNCRGAARFGVSQRAVEFVKKYDWSSMSWRGDVQALRQEICKFWSSHAEINPQHIKFGTGSMRVIQKVNQLFLEGPRTKALGVAPQFYGYPLDVMTRGAVYKGVLLNPEENFKFNRERFLAEITPDCSIIYIDNPNNPTGQLISLGDLEEVVKEAQRKDVAVLVDEAYGDCAEKGCSAINLVNRYENLTVTRSFTKGYRFAKLGYGILSPKLSAYYDKIDFPPPIAGVDAAIAREALLDEEFIRFLRQAVKSVKDKLAKGLEKRGYLISETHESCEIFVLGHKNRDIDLWEHLLDKGISTAAPSDFYESTTNLGTNHVRVGMPAKAEDFLSRV